MGGLEVGIELVQRVAEPVRAQVDRLFRERRGYRPIREGRIDAVLVGVVAEVENEVEVVLDHVAVGRVVPARDVLTRGDGEGELVHPVIAFGCGAEVADRALLTTAVELEEVVGTRAEAADLGVHRVRQVWRRRRLALRHDVSHRVVASDPPAHRDLRPPERRRVGWIGCQPGPQHDARRGGIAGGDAQGERIAGEARGRFQRAARQQCHGHRRAGTPPHVLQEPAAVDGRSEAGCAHDPSRVRC